ncbi:MAG: ATP-binding protein [Thermoleophilaceae bacterium]|nr:ATP-binding protein [Thermoleophilaceae bacterium]
MIDIEIDIRKSELDLCLPAEPDSLPIIRQAVRSLGEAAGADLSLLEDAELAVTEVCANVVAHAYESGKGSLEVTLRPSPTELVVIVRDSGRGMTGEDQGDGRHGYGLALIEALARQVDIRSGEDRGTEVEMRLGMGDEVLSLNGSAGPEAAPVERMARRLVAVIAAQTDMPSDRLTESLLAVEIAARHAPRYLAGDRIQLSLERLPNGFELCLGPLVDHGARALVRESELPVIGAVIERLADHIGVEPIEIEPGPRSSAAERLRLRIGSR